MTKVAIWGPNLRTQDATMHIHKPGCADTKRGIYVGHRSWEIEVQCEKDIVLDIYPPDEFLYEEDGDEWHGYKDHKIFPCVGDLPEE